MSEKIRCPKCGKVIDVLRFKKQSDCRFSAWCVKCRHEYRGEYLKTLMRQYRGLHKVRHVAA